MVVDATAAAKLDDAGVWNRVRVPTHNQAVFVPNGTRRRGSLPASEG